MSFLSSQQLPAIVVTLNYRLHVLGFLGSELLRPRDPEARSTGNYGLQDQRLGITAAGNSLPMTDPKTVLGKFDHELTVRANSLEIMVFYREIIPFYGRTIQVSELL